MKKLQILIWILFLINLLIIKGCADEQFNKFIYSQLIQKIQGVVSSIMYGEACSSVPIYKKK